MVSPFGIGSRATHRARHAISTRRALLPDAAAPSARRPSSAARLPSRQQLHIHQNNSVQRDRAAHARAYQTRYRASVNLHRADEMPPRCPAVRWRSWLASTGSSAMVQHIFGAEPWPERARKFMFAREGCRIGFSVRPAGHPYW